MSSGALKARFDLVPPRALRQVALAFTHGAIKHGDDGWRQRKPAGEFAAAMRHSWAWLAGERNDPESGLSHIAHAAARLLILLELVLSIEDPNQET